MSDVLFLADAMLGGLVRWLRVLDFDTRFDTRLSDAELVQLAARENRILLTRDRHLLRFLRPARALLIASDAPLAQLREVVSHYRLQPPPRLFARCLVCNNPLRPANPQEVRALAPASALGHDDKLLRCDGCGRIYWRGSHTRRMRRQLAQALPEWFPSG